MNMLQSQLTFNSWEDSNENENFSYYSKEFIETNSFIENNNLSENNHFIMENNASNDRSSSIPSSSSSNTLSFSDKGIFTKLFNDEEAFKEKSEQLRILAAEVQDISNMSSMEKEMFIHYFKQIPKSNIYKNIYRCFNRFMLNSNNHISIECIDINNKDITLIRKQYQKFLKNVSYPEMLYRIMKNERYSKFFYYYLQDFFLDDLYSGNFKQLKDHFISSIFFLICLSEPSHLESIKFHKK